MSNKFNAEIKSLINLYEANDNIEPGSAAGFVDALSNVSKAVYGAYNFYKNFTKFYKYALRQSYKINEEARNLNTLSKKDPFNMSLLTRKAKFQHTINELKTDMKKWRQYLEPLNTKSAKRAKAGLDVIDSVIQNAEYGNIKRKSQSFAAPQPQQQSQQIKTP